MATVSKRPYQPSILRLPSLLFLLASTLVLIALTELACRRLPAHSNSGIISSIQQASPEDIDAIIQKRHAKRQNGTDDSGASSVAVGDVGGSGDGNGGSVPTAPGAPAPGNFLPLSDTPTTSVVTNAPAPSNFLPVSVNLSPATTTTPIPVAIPLSSNSDVSPIASSPATVNPSIIAGDPNSGNFLPIANPTTPPTLSTIPTSTLPITTSNGTNTATFTTGTAGGSVYTLGPGGVIYIGDDTFYTSQPTSTTLSDGATVIVGPTGAVSIQAATQETPVYAVTSRDYVVGTFVPTILAVIFSIPWHILASAIKEMEPFYQLNRPEGVPTDVSLTVDYRASINIIACFNALRKRHYLVWWSGLVSVMVLFLAPLASETVFIGFAGSATCTATSLRVGCNQPELSVFPPAARAVEGILAFVAVMTVGLAIAIWRRSTGVWADPSSIAGLATLFHHQPLIDKFRHIHTYAPSSKQLAKALQGSLYRIGFYLEVDGSTRYGMHLLQSHAEPAETEYKRMSSQSGEKYTSAAVDTVHEVVPLPKQKRTSASLALHPAAMTAFCIFVCGLMALLIYYNRVGADTAFERFMDSESFGTSFLFTAVGVVIKLYWTLLDDESRTSEPYRQLTQGSAHPRSSILLSPHSTPFTGLFHSLRHAHFFNAYIALVAILAEALIVCLANVPFKPGHAFMAYTVATWLSVAILLMMVTGVVWRLCRNDSRDVRRPDTIAGVLVQICGSHMLPDFGGMAEMDEHSKRRTVMNWGKRYTMGNLIGTDGVARVGVDEDMFFRGASGS